MPPLVEAWVNQSSEAEAPTWPSAQAARAEHVVTGAHQMEPESHWSLRLEGCDHVPKLISSLLEVLEGSVVSNAGAG